MSKPADLILSAYSFIYANTLEKLLSLGHHFKDGKPIPSFDENLLVDLCSEVQQIFSDEEIILQLKGNFVIVGNINGSLHDLIRVLKYSHDNGSKLLFLGDYIDIGDFSLECLSLLFAKKVSQPDSIFLIRGEHEFSSICNEYGFKNDIINGYNFEAFNQSKYKIVDQGQSQISNDNSTNKKGNGCYKYTEKLYSAIMKVFSYLPLAALVNETTFCIHGGLSPKLHLIDNISKVIKRPLYLFEDNSLLTDMLYSDPTNSNRGLFIKKTTTRGHLFNQESVIIFLEDNSLTRMVRSHQYVISGSIKSFNDRCITISSVSKYDRFDSINSAVFELFQKNNGYRITTFFPIRRLSKKEALFYKVPCFRETEKKIPLSISLIQPQMLPSKSVTSRDTESRKSSQRSDQICASSRLTFINPLKAQLKAKKFARKPLLHESFSADFQESD